MQGLQRDIACPDIKISQSLPDVVSDVDYLQVCGCVDINLIAKNSKEGTGHSLNKGRVVFIYPFRTIGRANRRDKSYAILEHIPLLRMVYE